MDHLHEDAINNPGHGSRHQGILCRDEGRGKILIIASSQHSTDDLAQITKINFPTHPGRAKLAYIEFVDEAGMKAGLEKHAEVCVFLFRKFVFSPNLILENT